MHSILKKPFSTETLKKLISSGELPLEIISKDTFLSFFYATDILKGRFSEGEESISTNADYSFSYAIDILKGRFKSGEPVIKTEYYLMYLQYMKEYLTEEEYIELKLEF